MNLDLLNDYAKMKLNETGGITMGDLATLIGVSKSCLKYYEEEKILIPDFIVSHGHQKNMRLYKLETAEAFIKWYKTKSLPKTMVVYPQSKTETQDEIEWRTYLKELHS